MEEFVAYIIKNLVSKPEEVSIATREEPEMISIEIRVAQEDVGKVIGRRGNTINALRTIVRTVATRLGRRAQIELIQPDEEKKVLVEEAPAQLVNEEAAEAEQNDSQETEAAVEEVSENVETNTAEPEAVLA